MSRKKHRPTAHSAPNTDANDEPRRRSGKTGPRAGRGPTRGSSHVRRRSHAGRWAGLALAAALALVALRALPGVAIGEAAPVRVGSAAPELKVRTLDGQRISLSGLRGKVVLVNFWATWCPPCRAEMPGFERVWRERQKDGFVVLGLSADEDGPGPVNAFLGERGITYPVAMASSSAKRAFGGANALPESFLVDRHGSIRRTATGVFDERLLRQEVNRLLAEP